MSEVQLNKEAYQKLIDENIAALEKHMPEHSLEKKHTIEVLKWSVKQIYDKKSCHLPCPVTDVGGVNNCQNHECGHWY